MIHFPGVFSQQQKQPLHGAIVFSDIVMMPGIQ
jgi:hypothetical protein